MRRALMYALMCMIVLIGVEAVAYAAIGFLKPAGLFYDPSMVTQSYSDYLARRDGTLGWEPPRHSQAAVDGTRRDPAFPTTARACVSLFGDSFTWSAEVADGDAWGSVLGTKLKCRVSNYGVGGYGTDQAYLRFLSLPPDGGVVLLNHTSENILRNVNRYRNLLYPGREFAFKPRFIDQNGTLAPLPLPEIAPAEISRFLASPALYLDHEYFLPGGDSGLQFISFPYAQTVLKAMASNYHARAKLTNTPRHAAFYRADHPSGALTVTDGIVRAFTKQADARWQIPVVTAIPTCDDLKYFRARGVFPYDPLVKSISAQSIRHIDFGVRIAERIRGAPPENFYASCSAHFNAAGYRLLADIAFDYLSGDAELQRQIAGAR